MKASAELKPTERFSNRADDYRCHRPGYPIEVMKLMRETCGLRAGAAVADIGAGTGILTKLLLESGFEVTAVEPNDAMRAAAEQDLGGFSGYRSVAKQAEKTGLGEGSFDAITVAQAFHWFDHQATRQEFQRLLRADGWVFIIWNNRQKNGSRFGRDYEDLLKTLGPSYERVVHRDQEALTRGLQGFFPRDAMRRAEFDNPHTMDWPGLRGRFLSSSYVPARADPRHREYLMRLEEIFQKHASGGQVTFGQKTAVYYGKLEQEARA